MPPADVYPPTASHFALNYTLTFITVELLGGETH